MKSERSTKVSRSNISMFIARARSSDTNGSNATMRIPKAAARCATSFPIRPKPTTPKVLSNSSTPSHLLRSQRPSFKALCACGTLRATASNIAMVCSAADTMFDSGAFATITPRRVADSTSTLSRPTPARPTTMRESAAAINASSTWVADRTMRAWAPLMAEWSCSGDNPVCTSTSWPAARSLSKPPSANSSETRIFAIRQFSRFRP